MRTEITTQIECWSCENGHNWTIDQDPQYPKASPYDEGYTISKFPQCRIDMPGIGSVEIQPGECPLCFMAGVWPVPKMALGTDPDNNMSTMSVIDPATVSELTKEIVTGKDTETGDPIKEEVSLSKTEQTAITDKINADLDRMAAMEYNPNQAAVLPTLPSETTSTDQDQAI